VSSSDIVEPRRRQMEQLQRLPRVIGGLLSVKVTRPRWHLPRYVCSMPKESLLIVGQGTDIVFAAGDLVGAERADGKVGNVSGSAGLVVERLAPGVDDL
jgi:hypothetical protein